MLPAAGRAGTVRRIFVDAVDPDDYAALGRAMQSILAVDLSDGDTVLALHLAVMIRRLLSR